MRLLTIAGVVVIAAIVAAVVGLRGGSTHHNAVSTVASTSAQSTAQSQAPKPGPARTGSAKPVDAPAHAAGVPDQAYRTLAEIDAGRWPGSANAPGTKGGDTWQNRSGQLPKSDSSGKAIAYKEWDVNPKQKGQTRDAERIVTGSDGSAYYTGDHYKTFTRMR
ncbi:MAG: ribonuclease [Nocardia sp.]|nr:ribonuclease [Nocardia sp.]